MQKFIGTGVALVTPFRADKSVDFEALEKLVNYQIDNGINYLVVLGTTGEPATLTQKEKEAVKAKIIEVNNKRLPLVLGIGGNNTTAVAEEIKTTNLSIYPSKKQPVYLTQKIKSLLGYCILVIFHNCHKQWKIYK